MSSPTHAMACGAACADDSRGDGAIPTSPMGPIPTLAARPARQTFAADLLLTTDEAFPIDPEGNMAPRLPYTRVSTIVAAGRRP